MFQLLLTGFLTSPVLNREHLWPKTTCKQARPPPRAPRKALTQEDSLMFNVDRIPLTLIAFFFKGAQWEETTNTDNIFKWMGYFRGFQSSKESGLWLLSDCVGDLFTRQLVFSGEMAEKWRRASFWLTDLTDFEWSDVLTQIFAYIPLQRFKVQVKGSPKYGKPIWHTPSAPATSSPLVI